MRIFSVAIASFVVAAAVPVQHVTADQQTLPSDDAYIGMPDRTTVASTRIDWSSTPSAATYTISQCETIVFQWDSSDATTPIPPQQHSIVEFPTQQAYEECDVTNAVELLAPPSPVQEVVVRSEEDALACRKRCRSTCCAHDGDGDDDAGGRRTMKTKTCNTSKERECRDDCFSEKDCGKDDKDCTAVSC